MKFPLFAYVLFIVIKGAAQLPTPTILEVEADDRIATIFWNSKTNVYTPQYDPDKQAGIYSYLIEWGKQSEGFVNQAVTPYRLHQVQPLEPGVIYMARVYGLDNYGVKSAASATVLFQHDASRVDSMRLRLNGFFDDMNYPMGPFPEKHWNQSYSGCMKVGVTSQHINNQFHGHNVVASDGCDRSIASSRARELFDFTGRTGTIEFDLDGSKRSRQNWYLDLSPASRKRDLTGHTAIESLNAPTQADPPYLLRIIESDATVKIQLADSAGWLHTLPNVYQNNACGDLLQFCPGENLVPMINVRRHWKIELSATWIKLFINEVLIIDGSLVTPLTPQGLPYEVAQVNWLFFSYNTPKENMVSSMVHWDNFGFDAPAGYQPSTVVHNYTNGELGTTSLPTGNEASAGVHATMATPALVTIPIPDSILDQNGNDPLLSELMFTMQGGNYQWQASDHILVNGNYYTFPEPTSTIPSLPNGGLLNSIRPYSAILPLDASHLLTGANAIEFYLNDTRLLNIHIELKYPLNSEPVYTEPKDIHSGLMTALMNFQTTAQTAGPGIVFEEIDNIPFYMNEFVEHLDAEGSVTNYVKTTPVSGVLDMTISANCVAQLTATGKTDGIAYFEISVDSSVVLTVPVNTESPVAFLWQNVSINTATLSNGVHELFVRAYDVNGNASQFDAFQAHAEPGEYLPVLIDVQNPELYDIKVFLEGPYDALTGLMSDELRQQGLIPLQEPYTALGYAMNGGSGTTIDSSVLLTSGPKAVVDWVLIELRRSIAPWFVDSSYTALLLRDGTVVAQDGFTSVFLNTADMNPKHIAVRHRNHLGVMNDAMVAGSSFPINGTPAMFNLTDTATATYGTNALKLIGNVAVMFMGNVVNDGALKYAGSSNDRDPILVAVGGSTPTNTAQSYTSEDCNMDGYVKYTGSRNDRDPILVNIGGSIPTATQTEQLW